MFLNFFNKFKYLKERYPVFYQITNLKSEGYEVKLRKKLLNLKFTIESSPLECYLRPLSSDIHVFRQVIKENEYLSIIKLIEQHEESHRIKVIVDAGANIGLTSLFFNNYFPNAKIIAIEPDPSNLKIINKNIQINRLFEKVSVLNKALWKNETDYLSVSNDFRDGDYWSKSIKCSEENSPSNVKAVTLKNIIEIISPLSIIDLLKIDIEGSECELFSSSDFIFLLKTSVKYLCLEIHDELSCREKINQVLNTIEFEFEQNNETTVAFNTAINVIKR